MNLEAIRTLSICILCYIVAYFLIFRPAWILIVEAKNWLMGG